MNHAGFGRNSTKPRGIHLGVAGARARSQCRGWSRRLISLPLLYDALRPLAAAADYQVDGRSPPQGTPGMVRMPMGRLQLTNIDKLDDTEFEEPCFELFGELGFINVGRRRYCALDHSC